MQNHINVLGRLTVRMIALGALAGNLTGAPAWATPPDAWITTKAKIVLITTPGVSSTAVSIDTVDGVVSLHGTVGSAAEKSNAAVAVQPIDGVKSVHNLLHEARNITTDVQNGIVRVTGTVPNQEQRLLAALCARGAVGVRAVKDDLTVAQ